MLWNSWTLVQLFHIRCQIYNKFFVLLRACINFTSVSVKWAASLFHRLKSFVVFSFFLKKGQKIRNETRVLKMLTGAFITLNSFITVSHSCRCTSKQTVDLRLRLLSLQWAKCNDSIQRIYTTLSTLQDKKHSLSTELLFISILVLFVHNSH